ncbi:hypothetical protein JCM10207_002772 [Rhodosporidiobolus poonsookiae]
MSWQEHIRQSLLARDQREQALSPLITHFSRLAHHSAQLKDRNRALLNAATTARATGGGGGAAGAGAGADNPVRLALISSLESQLAQTRADLAEQYKVQSTNAQRLLALTDSLRDAEERGRDERDELRKLRSEVDALRERARWHKEIVSEKEKQLVILQDDHQSLSLELTQLELQNDNLKTDNAALLQRWLESKAEEANRMNEANAFLEEAKRLKEEAERIRAGKDEDKSEAESKGKEKA